ncbi:MAG: DUF3553 domain-containing protein [Alphaproteobacteria bacterium]
MNHSSRSTVLAPGIFVRHPSEPDWGIGQVQSVVQNRVTVNFENAGKQLILSDIIALIVIEGLTTR